MLASLWLRRTAEKRKEEAKVEHVVLRQDLHLVFRGSRPLSWLVKVLGWGTLRYLPGYLPDL